MTNEPKRPREFWVYHSAINMMAKHHHIITEGDWHLKENKDALQNPKLWCHVIEYPAYQALLDKVAEYESALIECKNEMERLVDDGVHHLEEFVCDIEDTMAKHRKDEKK